MLYVPGDLVILVPTLPVPDNVGLVNCVGESTVPNVFVHSVGDIFTYIFFTFFQVLCVTLTYIYFTAFHVLGVTFKYVFAVINYQLIQRSPTKPVLADGGLLVPLRTP